MSSEPMIPEDNIPEKQTIFAAGGILWKGNPFESDIAIIHRTRYSDEWCLPKGKYKDEDKGSLENTALREIKEETGCEVEIYKFATIIEYKVKGYKKQVFYWHLKLIGECNFVPNEEVDQLVWLPIHEALKILTHSDQRNLIRNLLSPEIKPQKKSWNIWHRLIKNKARFRRLAGSLLSYRTELENRICSNSINDECINVTIRKLLSDAENSLKQCRIDEAWKCFHAAQRMEIYLNDSNQLLVKAAIIRNEATKLGPGWRQKAILEILEVNKLISLVTIPQDDNNLSDLRERIVEAALIRDESYNNQAYKDEIIKEHKGFLAELVLIIGVAFIIFFLSKNLLCVPQNIRTLVNCLLFGMLGALFSAALKLQSVSQSSRIPELLNAKNITFLRVLIGGISAFILFVFIKSQFVATFFVVDLNKTTSALFSYYFIAFVAGFSERLVFKTIESVTKEKEESKPK